MEGNCDMSSPSAPPNCLATLVSCLQLSLSSSISRCKTTRGTVCTNRCEEKLLDWIFHVANGNFFCSLCIGGCFGISYSLSFCCCLSFSSSLFCSSFFCGSLFCSCFLCGSLFCSSFLCGPM